MDRAISGELRTEGRVARFLFAPASPLPLAGLRIGLGLTLLLQAYYVRQGIFDLFGATGIMQGALGAYEVNSPLTLNYWLARIVSLGVPEPIALTAFFVVYLLSLAMLTVGWHTRAANVVAWLLQTLLTQAQTTSYGLDQFAHTALFLLIWTPAGRALSVDCRKDANCNAPGWDARLSLRVFQLWLCIAYLGSGLTKAVGHQWWTGEAIWRSLMLPSYYRYDLSWLADYPVIPQCLAIGTLVVECGYAIFIWPRRTRKLWVALTLGLHLGIGIFLQLHLFALIMCVLTFTIFGLNSEWNAAPSYRRVRRWRRARPSFSPP